MPKTAYIVAALGLAIAAPAFASASGGHLGVDISNAGRSREEHMAFFGKLSGKDKGTIQQDCIKQLNLLTDQEKTFCEAVRN